LDPRSPNNDNTVDTHEVGAALLRSLGQTSAQVSQNFGNPKPGVKSASGSAVTGLSGTYGFYADAVRQAAAKEGVPVAAMMQGHHMGCEEGDVWRGLESSEREG